MHRFKKTLITLALITTAIWANNTTLFTTPTGGTKLIAHRGVHHVYAGNNRTADTCRAPNVDPITHDFIENTIPSMQAAFEYGADVVELDVHLTSDKTFAVFHDWTLDCQTNGVGITHKHTIADLQKLDVGYNISHNGTDFPLRGTGQTMPTLRDVFNANLNGKFLINLKSDRRSEGTALATLLKTPFNRSQIFGVYGGAAPTQRTIERTPNLRGYHRNGLKSCLIKYMALGWSGYVPAQCRNTMAGIPINYAPPAVGLAT